MTGNGRLLGARSGEVGHAAGPRVFLPVPASLVFEAASCLAIGWHHPHPWHKAMGTDANVSSEHQRTGRTCWLGMNSLQLSG